MSLPPAVIRPTLTIALGFASSLQILYPNGKTIDLPLGEAEARLVEILEGFRRDLRLIKAERAPQGKAPLAYTVVQIANLSIDDFILPSDLTTIGQ